MKDALLGSNQERAMRISAMIGALLLTSTFSASAATFKCQMIQLSKNFAVPDKFFFTISETSDSLGVTDPLSRGMGHASVFGKYTFASKGRTKLSWTLSNISKSDYLRFTKQSLGNRFVYTGYLTEATGEIKLTVSFPTEYGNKNAIQRAQGMCQRI